MKHIFYSALIAMSLILVATTGAFAQGKCPLSVGSNVPTLAGLDINGNSVSIEDYRGKWVYVDFWASWCGPCKKEIPAVIELDEDMKERSDFAVLSVSLDNEKTIKDLLSEVERRGINYPVVYDHTSDNAERWCVRTIPATFLVDPNGMLVETDVSPRHVRGMMESVPAHQQVMPDFAPAGNQTQRVIPRYGLLNDSPSTGLPYYRDLEVTLPIPSNQPANVFYQLIVASIEDGPGGTPIKRGAKFDIQMSFTNNPLNPTLVTIDNTTDNSVDPGELGSLPNLSFVIDRNEPAYRFTIPMPIDSIKMAYKLDLLNDGYSHFIDNSTVILESK